MKWPSARFFRRPLFLCLLGTVLLLAGFVAWWQWPQHYLRLAEDALGARQYEKAREYFGQYLSYRPGDSRARLLAARVARNLKEYYEAFEHLRRCREIGGNAEAIEIETALIGVERGEEPTAKLRQRADEDDEQALVILEVLIQHDLDNYRLRQALHELTRYLQKKPEDLQALLARGYVWERFLYFADALNDYRTAVKAHPESDITHLKLGETLLITGSPGEALEQFEWLAERKPNVPAVKLGLARCRRKLGQVDEAIGLLTALLKNDPKNGEVLWEMGQVMMDQSKTGEAETWLRKAVEVSPFDRRIAHGLSRCLQAQGKSKEAEKVNAQVAKTDADLKRLDEVRQLVMDRPQDAALRCEGGILFLRNGERQEGIRWLQLALRIDPNCTAARDALASAEKNILKR